MEHARISPSKLSRVLACPGSVALAEQFPEQQESKYAAEGTYLHEVMKEAIAAVFEMKALESWKGYAQYNVSQEHQILIEDVLQKLAENGLGRGAIFQDIRVFMNDDVNGTLDLAYTTNDCLHIVDFKFGSGIRVEAEDNPQLLAYLDGFLKTFSAHSYYQWWIWIYQPRLNNYQGVRVFKEDLDYFQARVEKTVALVNSSCAPFRPGEKQCLWCPAKGSCIARMQDIRNKTIMILSEFADANLDGTTWSNDQLAGLLDLEKEITTAFKDIRKFLHGQLAAGKEVPGYRLAPGRSTREWKEDTDIDHIVNLFPDLDTDDILEIKLRSPAQVEKLLPRADRAALVDLYTKSEGTPILVASDSAKPDALQNMFGDLEE